MSKYYVYEDWTLENIPRCFYVGKGMEGRVNYNKRNAHHTHVAKHLGIQRIIVFSTDVERDALNYEVWLIAVNGTYNPNPQISLNDMRCNRTIGGEGVSGHKHSEESKRKNSESNKIAQAGEKNGMYGRKHSKETIEKLSGKNNPMFGHKHSAKRKAKMAEDAIRIHTGMKRSEESKRKISKAMKGKEPWNKGKQGVQESSFKGRKHSDESKKKMSEARKGKVPWNKGLKKEQI